MDSNSAILLALILLLGMALRFYELGTESYWIDEMFSISVGQQSVHQLLASGRLDQLPAYYLPFHFWMQIFGTTEVSTRAFSALAGMGSIILICLIGWELFGKEVGLLGAFLMAISGFQIFYSQMTRFYGFFELMTLLSFLSFILALKSKRIIHFILYGAASMLMIYSHTFGVFILAAQNLFIILQGKKYGNIVFHWFICQILILLTFIPYFYSLILGASDVNGAVASQIWGLPMPTLMDVLRTVWHFILIARGERSWGNVLVNYSVAGVLLVAGTWVYAVRQGTSNRVSAARRLPASLQGVPNLTGKLLLVGFWLACPILLPFILSVLVIPIYAERYTISASPALYLLLALGLFSIRKVVPLFISLGVLVIMISPSLANYYRQDVNEQWREAAKYVEENSGVDEVMVFAPNDLGIQQKTFDWYYRGSLQGCGINVTGDVKISDLTQCIAGHDRFWVIMRGRQPNRYTSFFLNPDQTAMRMIKEHYFVGLSVHLFELTTR